MPRSRKSRKGVQRDTAHDWIGGVLSPGASKHMTIGDCVPVTYRDRAFRVRSVHLQVCGLKTSAAWQAQIYGPISAVDGIASTGPRLVGISPSSLVLTNPEASRFPNQTAGTHPLFGITCLCQSKSDPGAIRFIARLELELGPEEFSSACPLTKLADADAPSGSSGAGFSGG